MPRDRAIGLPQFIVIIIAAVALILAWDFGRRIVETLQLVQAAQTAEVELRQVGQDNQDLKQLKEYVKTDEFVKKKARIDLHYAGENETIIVPAATPAAKPTPVREAAVPPPARPFWEDWLDALFGPSQ